MVKETICEASHVQLSPTEIEALKEYRESVEILASKKLNLEFNNKDQHHAAIVMSAIFKNADKSIKIFTGSFSGHVSDDPVYLNELRAAINGTDKTVEVVFEQKPNERSECLKMLKDLRSKQPERINLRMLTDNFRKVLVSKGNDLNHFTVGDEQMFRYETDKEDFKAFCNFDDRKTAEVLLRNFTILHANATELN